MLMLLPLDKKSLLKIIVLQQVLKIKQILYQNEMVKVIKINFKLVVGDQNIKKAKNKLQKK